MLPEPGSHLSLDLDILGPWEGNGLVTLLTATAMAAWMTPPMTFPSLYGCLPSVLSHNVKLSWAFLPYITPSAFPPPRLEESLLQSPG